MLHPLLGEYVHTSRQTLNICSYIQVISTIGQAVKQAKVTHPHVTASTIHPPSLHRYIFTRNQPFWSSLSGWQRSLLCVARDKKPLSPRLNMLLGRERDAGEGTCAGHSVQDDFGSCVVGGVFIPQ